MHNLRFAALLAASATCLAQPIAATTTIDLRPRWELGQQFYVEHNFRATYTLKSEPSLPQHTLGEARGYVCRVAALHPDGGVTLEVRGDRVQIYEREGEHEQDFDSDRADQRIAMRDPSNELDCADVQRLTCAALMGHSYEVELSGIGRVRDVRGVDDVRRRALQAAASASQRTYATGVFEVGAEIQYWEAVFAALPFEAVRADATWDRIINMNNGPVRVTGKIGGRTGAEAQTIEYEVRESDTAEGTDERSRRPEKPLRRIYKATGTIQTNATGPRLLARSESGVEDLVINRPGADGEPGRELHREREWTASARVLTVEAREAEKAEARRASKAAGG